MVSSENTHVQTTANAIGSKISSKITEHNTSNTAHNDIRQDISNLNNLIGDAITYINLWGD